MTVAKTAYLDALQEILRLDVNTCTVEVCIASRKDDESLPEFRWLHLAEAVKKEFRDLVTAALTDYYKELQLRNLQLLDFDVESKLARHQVEYVDLSKRPYDHIVEQTRSMSMLQSLDAFKAELSFTRNMRFYVIILQPPQGQPIYFYRRYSP